MRPGPVSVASALHDTLAPDAPPRSVDHLVVEVILARGWETSRLAAIERAELWSPKVLGILRQKVTGLLERGSPTNIAFNSSSPDYIQGVCFVEPSDPPDVAEGKMKRLGAAQYRQALRDLSPDEFELLCGKVVKLLGVSDPMVSRRSADEGIDFYGQLALDSLLYPDDIMPTVQKQLRIWLVGQAKRYLATQAGTSEVREIVGAVALGRESAFGSKSMPLPGLAIRPADPVFTMLITSGTISQNAERLLSRSGVIGVDGDMLAAFLADRQAGSSSDGFDPAEFAEWLRS